MDEPSKKPLHEEEVKECRISPSSHLSGKVQQELAPSWLYHWLPGFIGPVPPPL